jgi:hypothetical protein
MRLATGGLRRGQNKGRCFGDKKGAGKVINKTGDTAKTVGEKNEGGKTVVEKTGDAAKTVGQKTGEGAKVVGEKQSREPRRQAAQSKVFTP